MISDIQQKNSSLISSTREQIALYAQCVFEPSDIIEIRRLPSKRSDWFTAKELAGNAGFLVGDNRQGENIYVGANPRRENGGTSGDDVKLARCLFADFDNIDVETVQQNIEASQLPEPTLLINSGHGVHAYWRLTESVANLSDWKELQKRLIATLPGTDKKIHDPPRIMSLQGLTNHKEPVAECVIVSGDPRNVYKLAAITKSLSNIELPQTTVSDPSNLSYSYHGKLERAKAWAMKCPPVEQGERSNAAFKLSAAMVKDFDLEEETAWDILQNWNRNNRPPLNETELHNVLRSAVKGGKHPKGVKLANNN